MIQVTLTQSQGIIVLFRPTAHNKEKKFQKILQFELLYIRIISEGLYEM